MTATQIQEWAKSLNQGVLTFQDIHKMVEIGALSSETPLEEGQIQPASLDLRVGSTLHRIQTSFLPRSGESVAQALKQFRLYDVDVTGDEGAILEVGCTYLVKLQESVDLPELIHGAASPKSTTGRLDIFCRLFTEEGERFDAVAAGYSGPIYLEITPMSFPIVMRMGDRLIQLRFRAGEIQEVNLKTGLGHWKDGVLFDDNNQPIDPNVNNGLWVSLGLKPSADGAPVAYRAKRNTPAVDLRNIGHYGLEQYWEAITPEDDSLVLYPNDFYILASAEKVCVPPSMSAEMVPFDITFGEIRVHYAGFFDPGFGVTAGKGVGTRAVLEVRNHGAPFRVTHGQRIARFVYEELGKAPEVLYGTDIQSNYANQGVKLAKQFKMVA